MWCQDAGAGTWDAGWGHRTRRRRHTMLRAVAGNKKLKSCRVLCSCDAICCVHWWCMIRVFTCSSIIESWVVDESSRVSTVSRFSVSVKTMLSCQYFVFELQREDDLHFALRASWNWKSTNLLNLRNNISVSRTQPTSYLRVLVSIIMISMKCWWK